MKQFNFIFLLALLFALSHCTADEATPDRPNILWIVSEDNSPLLGAYGDSLAVTPNLDRLADRGVVYENAFATTPVCAPSRFTLITGLYASVMGTENMRSTFPIPDEIRFFPKYLNEAGYYTTNNAKKDYNTVDQPEAWDESSGEAHYRNRAPGQPFFHVKNLHVTHESRLHDPIDTLLHDPEQMPIPPYHPSTPAIKKDWAHYYDQVSKMDTLVGEILDELEESGEAENTIVFYYSDHGGVLPRSKRYMFETGLRVPLIVYFPEKYGGLKPGADRTDRLVSFVDFPPTVLSLAGIEPPQYMHGQPFLGEYAGSPREYIHSYRARMDERFDLVRVVRDKEYLYVRNFMPHRIYGQHLAYLWRAPSMQSWYEEYLAGNLNEDQRRFFETKPVEELYRVSEDPYNVRNLAADDEYAEILLRMRKVNSEWMRGNMDLGFIPEETIDGIRGEQSLYEVARNRPLPIDTIIETAERASEGDPENLNMLVSRLENSDSTVRFWAATGLSVTNEKPRKIGEALLSHTDDPSPAVRIVVAEALYRYGNRREALEILESSLDDPHPFAKLRALNTLEALEIKHLPASLVRKVTRLMETDEDAEGTNYYVRRASTRLLQQESAQQ